MKCNKANLRDLTAATKLEISNGIQFFFVSPCDLQIFHSHPWIQVGVVIRKRSNRSQIVDFSAPETLKFDGWPPDIIEQFCCPFQALCVVSRTYVNWNWSYSPETLKVGQYIYIDLCDLDLWSLILAFHIVITSFNGNYSCKLHHDEGHCGTGVTGRQRDGETDRTVLRAAWSQLKYVWCAAEIFKFLQKPYAILF